AFYDGLMKLSDALHDRRLGRSSRSVSLQYALGGTIIADASVGLLGLSLSAAGIAGATTGVGLALCAIGLIISAIAITLGFIATKLVSTATTVWLNRCYIGRQYDTQFAPFTSIEHEQASLDLLSQGISLELTWEDYSGTYVTGETGPLGEVRHSKKVMIKARIPNLSKMRFAISLENDTGYRGSNEVFADIFLKTAETDSLVRLRHSGQSGEYDVSCGESSTTIERTVLLPVEAIEHDVRLNVTFRDERARNLSYKDEFLLGF
ncbi:hypothetical protein, partial [Salinicola aestuarinus]|uniref:hypothetical protein n=1 Tax=Salinicola aestuarinus TaxID=1949082 RepID=UPI001CB71F28